MKLSLEHKLFMGVCIAVIIIMLFVPRGLGLSAGFSAHLGSLRGSVEFEAFENFDDGSQKPCLVLFHANWCGHCKKMKPEWDKFKKENNSNNTGVIALDLENDENKDLMNKHGIKGFPTIKFFPNGHSNGNGEDYNGSRTADAFHSFVKGVSQRMPNQAASVTGNVPSANSAGVDVNSFVARNFDMQ